MKKILFNLFFKIWEIEQLLFRRKIKNLKNIYVIDIDNTLTIFKNDIIHKNPIPRLPMINFVKELIMNDLKVIYLSARDFRLYNNTIEWLSQQSILVNKNEVFLVPSAMHKIEYLQYLCSKNENITFIDDLSYNHENGEVLIFYDVIEKVKNLTLDYKGLNFINSL